MRATQAHFLALMAMELDDLKEDLQALVRGCAARREKGEITDYVFRENMAVYRTLAACIDCVRVEFKMVAPEEHTDLSALIKKLRRDCHARLKDHGFPYGLERTIERKMQKIATYLQGEGVPRPE